MDASQLIAQMLGLVYVVVGLGIFFDSPRYRKLITDMLNNAAFIYIGGIVALLGGYLIVTFGPNVWEVSFEGLVTLIGWIALLKGIILLIKPGVMTNAAKFWANNLQLAAGFCIIVGLALGYYGFV